MHILSASFEVSLLYNTCLMSESGSEDMKEVHAKRIEFKREMLENGVR